MPEHDGSSTGAGGRPRDVRERQCKQHHEAKGIETHRCTEIAVDEAVHHPSATATGTIDVEQRFGRTNGNDPTRCGGVTPGDEGAQRNCRERNCRWRLQCGES